MSVNGLMHDGKSGIVFSFGEAAREITNFTDEALYQPELNLN